MKQIFKCFMICGLILLCAGTVMAKTGHKCADKKNHNPASSQHDAIQACVADSGIDLLIATEDEIKAAIEACMEQAGTEMDETRAQKEAKIAKLEGIKHKGKGKVNPLSMLQAAITQCMETTGITLDAVIDGLDTEEIQAIVDGCLLDAGIDPEVLSAEIAQLQDAVKACLETVSVDLSSTDAFAATITAMTICLADQGISLPSLP